MTDKWSRWLLERRDAGNERLRELTLEWLRPIRARVLDLAGPLEHAETQHDSRPDAIADGAALRDGAPNPNTRTVREALQRIVGTYVSAQP